MREIKFRAWDIELKSWIDFTIPDDMPSEFPHDILENWCQFTGLKDKNGKEIYEGDIVKARDSFDTWVNSKVTFHYGSFGLKDFDGVDFVDLGTLEYVGDGTESTYPDDKNPKIEVIGNIYENGDLL